MLTSEKQPRQQRLEAVQVLRPRRPEAEEQPQAGLLAEEQPRAGRSILTHK